MKSIENISRNDFVVFYKEELKVEIVLEVKKDSYKISNGIFLPYEIKKEDILAIGNNETGKGKIKGLSGKYDVINQEKIDEIMNEK